MTAGSLWLIGKKTNNSSSFIISVAHTVTVLITPRLVLINIHVFYIPLTRLVGYSHPVNIHKFSPFYDTCSPHSVEF